MSLPVKVSNTCCAFLLSSSTLTTSLINQIKSNLDTNGTGMLMLSISDESISYLPYFGFAAASMLAFAGSVILNPAFAMDTVCCSIPSCIALLSSGFILSNSSIHACPSLHSGSTPACATCVPFSILTIPIVSPAALAPLPEVYMDLLETFEHSFSSSDFASDGSPTNSMLISLRFTVEYPPANINSIENLISS